MKSQLRNPNFAYLLVGLLTVLFINPLSLDLVGYSSPLLTSITFSATLVIGVWSLLESKLLFRLGLLLIIISLTVSAANAVYPNIVFRLTDTIVIMTFCGMSFFFILSEITSDLKVDSNRIIGAICLYLLLGIVFGLIYTIIELFLPGSFSNLPLKQEQVSSDLFYYSFVTITTLGYGDIAPLRPLSRTVAYFEAIVGVFYMSILIGSMISLLLNRAKAELIEMDKVGDEIIEIIDHGQASDHKRVESGDSGTNER